MFFGIRRPRILTARQLGSTAFQPLGEQLEAKILMAINLGGTADTAQPFISSVPYGIDMVNGSPTAVPTATGAGYSVADVADLTGNNSYDSLVIGAGDLRADDPLRRQWHRLRGIRLLLCTIVVEFDGDAELA